jgi:hypothetical protein
MDWRTVKGVEHLVRSYRKDGKEVRESLGQRSPSTERRLQRFNDDAVRFRHALKEGRSQVDLVCRVAKAHGIGRLPGRFAETLDRFWRADINARLSLFGGSALFAYESGSKVFARHSLTRDDHLQFVARSEDLALLGLDEVARACDVDGTGTRLHLEPDQILIRSRADERVLCEIFLPAHLFRRFELPEAFRAALLAPGLRAVTVSRDSRPIEITALEPQTYAALAHCMRSNKVWAERAEFVCAMVRDRWPDDFEESQAMVLGIGPGF